MGNNGSADTGETAGKPVVFISYSHKDMEWMIRLERHLRPLEAMQVIKLAVDTKIEAGDAWRLYIQKGLSECRVAILLLSIDFFNSDFIIKEEFPQLLKKAMGGNQMLLPIYIGPIAQSILPSDLADLQGGNDPKDYLLKAEEHEVEDLFARISHRIRLIFGGQQALLAAGNPESPFKIGRDAYKFCNRETQVSRFVRFLKDVLGDEDASGRSMAVFIPGEKREEHASFVDVLMKNLEDYLVRLPGWERNGLHAPHSVPWPKVDNLEDMKKDLLSNLFSVLQPGSRGPENAADLPGLPNIKSLPYVLLEHKLYVNEWSNAQTMLLQWYIGQFWDEVSGLRGKTRFIVFFSVIYKELRWPRRILGRLLPDYRENIRAELEGFSKSPSKRVSVLVLPELEPVPEEKVRDWFDERRQNEVIKSSRDAVLKRLFENSPDQSMNEVEKILRDICHPFK